MLRSLGQTAPDMRAQYADTQKSDKKCLYSHVIRRRPNTSKITITFEARKIELRRNVMLNHASFLRSKHIALNDPSSFFQYDLTKFIKDCRYLSLQMIIYENAGIQISFQDNQMGALYDWKHTELCAWGLFILSPKLTGFFLHKKNSMISARSYKGRMISSPSDPLYLSNEGFYFKAVLVSDFVLTLSQRERGIVYLSKQKCLLEMLSPICDK